MSCSVILGNLCHLFLLEWGKHSDFSVSWSMSFTSYPRHNNSQVGFIIPNPFLILLCVTVFSSVLVTEEFFFKFVQEQR
jgi:hypothetical protein